jgi:AraC family transcriptional regulator
MSAKLANSLDEVTRLLGGSSPPVIPDVLDGDTRITGRWYNPPFEGHVPPLNDHCIVAHMGGCSKSCVRLDGNVSRAIMVPGTISFVPRGEESWRSSSEIMEVTNVYLGAQRLQSCADEYAGGQQPELYDRVGHDDPHLFSLMTMLNREVEARDATSRLFIEHIIDLVCLQLLRRHSVRFVAMPKPTSGLARWQVARVTAYVQEHLASDIGLVELSNLVGLSRFHFCGAFKAATGHTPYQWVLHQRMRRARKLLADPALRIVDVALAVGYESPSAFSAGFRRIVGMTPREFRVRH